MKIRIFSKEDTINHKQHTTPFESVFIATPSKDQYRKKLNSPLQKQFSFMENMANTKQKVSLYEKLGAEEGLRRIVNDILDKNLNNPLISHYFRDIDMPRLKQLVFEFFSMGTGGPHQYTGRDMRTSHSRMNISEEDFQSGNEDVSLVLKEHGIPQEEINEVIAILDSMKADIVRK